MNYNVFQSTQAALETGHRRRNPALNLPGEGLWSHASDYEATVQQGLPNPMVRFRGTLWRVRSQTSSLLLEAQQRVLVVGRNGNVLYVEALPESSHA